MATPESKSPTISLSLSMPIITLLNKEDFREYVAQPLSCKLADGIAKEIIAALDSSVMTRETGRYSVSVDFSVHVNKMPSAPVQDDAGETNDMAPEAKRVDVDLDAVV